MAFKSIGRFFSKEDSLAGLFEKSGLLTDRPALRLNELMEIYRKLQDQGKEEELVRMLINTLQKKKCMVIKLKVTVFLLYISRQSSWDIPQLLMGRKLKVFCEEALKKRIGHTFELVNGNREEYVQQFVVLPVHGYLIKLSMNEELYETCKSGEVPHDELFRRGQRIRFIWVFKVFNLINLLLPMFDPLVRLSGKYPEEEIWPELLLKFFEDVTVYVKFITLCLGETLQLSNPLLLPYADCLQFFESVKEYDLLRDKLDKLHTPLKKLLKESYNPVQTIKVDQTIYRELQMLSIRIQLISSSLRSNNQQENQRLATEYNQKVESYEQRLRTEGDDD